MASNGYYDGNPYGNDDSFLWGNQPGYAPPDTMGVPQDLQDPWRTDTVNQYNVGDGFGSYNPGLFGGDPLQNNGADDYLFGMNPTTPDDPVPYNNGIGGNPNPVSTIPQFPNVPGVLGQIGPDGQPITYDGNGNVVNVTPAGVRMDDPSVVQAPMGPAPTGGGLGLPGGQLPIPVPGISWPVALGATALLNNGNIFGGGGSITNLPTAVGNVVSDPVGSIQSTATNLGNQLQFPSAGQAGGVIAGAWPSTDGANGGPLPQSTLPKDDTGGGLPQSNPVVPNQGGSVGIWAGGSGQGDQPAAPNPQDVINQQQNNVAVTAAQRALDQNQANVLTTANTNATANQPPNGPTVPGVGVVPAGGGNTGQNTNPGVVLTAPTGNTSGGDTTSTAGRIVPAPPTPPDTGPTLPGSVTPTNPGTGTGPGENAVPPIITPPGGTTTPAVTVPPVVPTTMPTITPPTAPLDRNYLREGTQSTADLNALWGQIAGLYGNASGAYGNADYANWQTIANQYGGANSNLTGLANQQTADANTALRTNNLNDVQNLYGQAQGIRNAANPYLYGNSTTGQQGALDAYTHGATNNLQYAQNQLNQAGNLSPEDVRNSQQAAREAWQARGLVNSPGAVGAEILNRSNLTQQRQQQAFGNVNTALSSMQPAVQTASANQFDPFGTILGSQYGQQTNNAGSNQNLFSNTASFSSGQQGNQFVQNAFNPYNQYANDVYGSNFNAANAGYISNLNNNAALQGAQSGSNANLASGFLNSLFQVGQANHWWGS